MTAEVNKRCSLDDRRSDGGRHDTIRHEDSPTEERGRWWQKEVEKRDRCGWPLPWEGSATSS